MTATRTVARMTDEQLDEIVDSYTGEEDAERAELIDAATREQEQRAYASDPDEGVRIGTGNGRSYERGDRYAR